MQSRIPNPVLSVPGVLDALQNLSKAADDAASQAGLSRTTLELVNLRASQINGCAVCLDMHSAERKKLAKPTSASSPWPPGGTPRTSPMRSKPHWPWPRQGPVWLIRALRYPTRCSTRRPSTTTKRPWPRWSFVLRPSTPGTGSMSSPVRKPGNGLRNGPVEPVTKEARSRDRRRARHGDPTGERRRHLGCDGTWGPAALDPLVIRVDGLRIILATPSDSPTARNSARSGVVRLALGTARDVTTFDAATEVISCRAVDALLAETYRRRVEWDPRHEVVEHSFLVATPTTVRAWRSVPELEGRTIMRDGHWLDA